MKIQSPHAILASLMFAVALPAVAAIDSSTPKPVEKWAYINVEAASDGSMSFTCVGVCNAKGDMDFSAIASAVRVNIAVTSSGLDVSFCKPPGQTVLLARKSDIPAGTSPTSPTTLPTFHDQANPHAKSDVVAFTDNNNDHTEWAYALVMCQKKADGTTSTFTYDPGIINH